MYCILQIKFVVRYSLLNELCLFFTTFILLDKKIEHYSDVVEAGWGVNIFTTRIRKLVLSEHHVALLVWIREGLLY